MTTSVSRSSPRLLGVLPGQLVVVASPAAVLTEDLLGRLWHTALGVAGECESTALGLFRFLENRENVQSLDFRFSENRENVQSLDFRFSENREGVQSLDFRFSENRKRA